MFKTLWEYFPKKRCVAGLFLLFTFVAALSHSLAHDISGHTDGHFDTAKTEPCLLGKTPLASVPVAAAIDLPDILFWYDIDLNSRQVYARIIRHFKTRAPPLA
jgi:hypothetical protein